MAEVKRWPPERGARDGNRRPAPRRLSSVQVAERAHRELVQITGLEFEGVTSLQAGDDGIWKVSVELLEFSRIPNSDDILGTYEASIDASGDLLGYRRVRRYARSRSLQEQGSW
jgi:hypothetical protein